MSLPAQVKRNVVRAILNKEISVTEISKKLGVARKTIYAWIRIYKETPSNEIATSLGKNYVKGKTHPRAVYPKVRAKLIKLVIVHPEWGCRRYSLELKSKGINLGYFGIYKLLESLGASTYELRKNFKRNYAGPGRLSADIKLSAVNKVFEGKVNISKLAKEHGVARKTIYEWIKKYQTNIEKGLVGMEALKDGYPEGEKHPSAIYPFIQNRILETVSKKPALSIHKIAELIGASSYSIWKVLDKFGLNNYQKRFAYAQSVTPIAKPVVPVTLFDRVRLVWEEFLTGLAPAPPPRLAIALASAGRHLFKVLKIFSISSIVSFAVVYSSFWWISYISTKAPSIALGPFLRLFPLLRGCFSLPTRLNTIYL